MPDNPRASVQMGNRKSGWGLCGDDVELCLLNNIQASRVAAAKLSVLMRKFNTTQSQVDSKLQKGKRKLCRSDVADLLIQCF